jgi:pimeloyl-ACP methyl ester carboxylesterase
LNTMQPNEVPDQRYTMTWSGGRGEVKFLRRSDGSRLRYFTTGTGPPLVLLHTVRTQLDYFQRALPGLWDEFTVYALDLPGMGWSDIVAGAAYAEPDLRAAVMEFVTAQDLRDLTLVGESMGAAIALSASIDLADRVKRVVAFNAIPAGGDAGRLRRSQQAFRGLSGRAATKRQPEGICRGRPRDHAQPRRVRSGPTSISQRASAGDAGLQPAGLVAHRGAGAGGAVGTRR